VNARWDTVAIIGVGLIGGSLGLGLRKRGLARRVVGIGRREATLREALECGAVSEITTDLAAGVAEADWVVVCTPVEQVPRHVVQALHAAPAHSIVTDAGSTKRSIVRDVRRLLAMESAAPRATFIGSHPMAGSEKTGVRHGSPDLLQSRLVIITPEEDTRPEDAERLTQFWQSLGARVERLSPAAHDQAVAAISHLPHAIASLLAANTSEDDLRLAATGWLDTTRIAAGDVELWRQILTQNRDCVLRSLHQFGKVLNSFTQALEHQDDAELTRLLALGKQRRDALAD